MHDQNTALQNHVSSVENDMKLLLEQRQNLEHLKQAIVRLQLADAPTTTVSIPNIREQIHAI